MSKGVESPATSSTPIAVFVFIVVIIEIIPMEDVVEEAAESDDVVMAADRPRGSIVAPCAVKVWESAAEVEESPFLARILRSFSSARVSRMRAAFSEQPKAADRSQRDCSWK